ncbi:MAG: DUF1600 domain-containing protein [Mycoplasmataceae bacterium]|jgi:hypothetical protein|nr:DUF1600 domain-containing protein [Mycoplasmataceae bacterium]
MNYKMNKLQPKRKHIHKSSAYILAWIGLLLGVGIVVFSALIRVLPQYINYDLYSRWYYILWFDWFEEFTIQNNILLIIFYALWLFAYRSKIFNSNKFLVFVASYIVLVFAIAWFMMSPIFVLQSTLDVNLNVTIDNINLHLITPLLFVVFFYFASKYPKLNIKNVMEFRRTWLLAFIYPLLYFTYLVSINFVVLPQSIFNPDTSNPSGFISVYSILTNYNPRCTVPVWQDGVWNYNNPDMVGSYWRFFTVPVALGFYSIELMLFTYLNNRSNGAYLKYKKVNVR